MMATAAIDNDILFKGAGYGLLVELIGAIPTGLPEVGVLGAARFVVTARLQKRNLARALDLFGRVMQQVEQLEPTEEEVRLAAELEYEAQRAGVEVDGGESQLCAIVMGRKFSWFVTGDKRAIGGFELLLAARGDTAKLANKVICLEQLLLRLVRNSDAIVIRAAVCSQADLDRTLSICFSCASPEVGPEGWAEGLASYVRELRASAGSVLAA